MWFVAEPGDRTNETAPQFFQLTVQRQRYLHFPKRLGSNQKYTTSDGESMSVTSEPELTEHCPGCDRNTPHEVAIEILGRKRDVEAR